MKLTHQVSLKRGQRKQLSPHLHGHTSQASKRLTAETLLGLVPKVTFAYSLRSPQPKLSGVYFCPYYCCFCVCFWPTLSFMTLRRSKRRNELSHHFGHISPTYPFGSLLFPWASLERERSRGDGGVVGRCHDLHHNIRQELLHGHGILSQSDGWETIPLWLRCPLCSSYSHCSSQQEEAELNSSHNCPPSFPWGFLNNDFGECKPLCLYLPFSFQPLMLKTMGVVNALTWINMQYKKIGA